MVQSRSRDRRKSPALDRHAQSVTNETTRKRLPFAPSPGWNRARTKWPIFAFHERFLAMRRLDEIAVAACRKGLFLVLGQGACRRGNDRHVGPRDLFSQGLCEPQTS